MCKCTSIQVFKYSSIQVSKFKSLQFNKMILPTINNVKARDPVGSNYYNIFPPQAGSPHVSQPLFTYDTLRQRDPYTRLDSDASSLGPSLSPSHQVHVPRGHVSTDSQTQTRSKSVGLLYDAFCKTWYFSRNFGVKT